MTPKINMAAISANIRRERIKQGLTLSELARRSGISKSYLHSLENGRVGSIGIETLGKIAGGLEVTFHELTGEIERHMNRDS
jgi:XRE family transcriptional regulator, master regulator for biofilm formation